MTSSVLSDQNLPSDSPGSEGEAFGPQLATVGVRGGLNSDRHHGAVVPPIHLSSTFSFEELEKARPYDYTRSGNPTRDLLGRTIADLEGGSTGVVTSTGMSAVHLVLQVVPPGGRVLAPVDCYGGTHRLLAAEARRGRLVVDWIDFLDSGAVAESLERGPDLVLIETPSNPLLRITDIEVVARAARGAGALVAVDNTFLSPARQRPIELGAELVIHSTTKYLNGHSDVVGGAVVCADPQLGEEVAWWANCLGLTGAPFDAYLTLRGARTLSVRMDQHERNAAAVAHELQASPAVRSVHYPGLVSHPGHEIARRQQGGFGAMISFELVGTGLEPVREFLRGLRYFTLAESLGGVESLVAHPATMTHAAMEAEARRRAGISDRLLRLSVGIEATSDLLADLRAGLARAGAVSLGASVPV